MKNLVIFALFLVHTASAQVNICQKQSQLFENYTFSEAATTVPGNNEEIFNWYLQSAPTGASTFPLVSAMNQSVDYMFEVPGVYVFYWEHFVMNEGNSSVFSGVDSIIVHPLPILTAADTTVCKGNPFRMEPAYIWYPDNPVPPVGIHHYKAVATTDRGCQDSVSIFVTVKVCEVLANPSNHFTEKGVDAVDKPSVYIPNAFSPNGDGVNDTFFFHSNVEMEVLEFTITDRWGGRRYNGIDPWDGSSLDPGVYYYTLLLRDLLTGTRHSFWGDVTLIN